MTEVTVQDALKQMSGLIDRFLEADFDDFTYDEISSAIFLLSKKQDEFSASDDLDILLGLIKQTIPYLYVARGYATADVPRELPYYESLGDAKEKFREIKRVGQLSEKLNRSKERAEHDSSDE